MYKYSLFFLNFFISSAFSYTVLNAEQYKKTVDTSRTQVAALLRSLQSHREENANAQIAWITNQLGDIPYLYTNAMGEGDWQPNAWGYKPGATHVKQNPVYRLDGLNCQTFVQVSMALLHSNTLVEFDKAILKIAYGAAGNPNNEIVRYYNRNNFIDADFNPINQRNGWLSEASSLFPYEKKTSAVITRQKWFSNQQDAVKVLSAASGDAMEKRYDSVYQNLSFRNFKTEKIILSYLPKEILAIPQTSGGYKPNTILLNKIPTPAVAEIVRDVKQWNRYGVKIKDIIGSELMISHLGLLYRQTFKHDELIYRKISCDDIGSQTMCHVQPIYCAKKKCDELMFAHATDGFPKSHVWYKNTDGKFICSQQKPRNGAHYTACNRVVTLPFYDYLTDYQYGSYSNMKLWSILGVHIERLN